MRYEHAATEALASMRLTVGILRDGPEQTARLEPGENRPVDDLAALTALVDRFGGPTGPKTELHLDASVRPNLPHTVQAAAYASSRKPSRTYGATPPTPPKSPSPSPTPTASCT
jgi:hypothetical protein